ncbi:hypothetical protein IC611_22345 [Proteus mirabilis]
MKPLWTEVSPIQVDVMGVPAGVPSAAPSKFIGGGVTTNGSAIAHAIWLGIQRRETSNVKKEKACHYWYSSKKVAVAFADPA